MFGTQKRPGSVRAVRAPVAASFSPAILVPPVARDRVMPLPAVAAAATAGTDEKAGRGRIAACRHRRRSGRAGARRGAVRGVLDGHCHEDAALRGGGDARVNVDADDGGDALVRETIPIDAALDRLAGSSGDIVSTYA